MEDLDGKILVVTIVAAGASRLTVEQVGGGEGVGGGWCGPTETAGRVGSVLLLCVLATFATHMGERGAVKRRQTGNG